MPPSPPTDLQTEKTKSPLNLKSPNKPFSSYIYLLLPTRESLPPPSPTSSLMYDKESEKEDKVNMKKAVILLLQCRIVVCFISAPHSFLHSLDKYLLKTYSVLEVYLGIKMEPLGREHRP